MTGEIVRKEDAFGRTVALLNEWGHTASFRAHYSGRGMYGKTVPAIDTDAGAMRVGMAWTEACKQLELHDETMLLWAPLGTDAMGMGKVYY